MQPLRLGESTLSLMLSDDKLLSVRIVAKRLGVHPRTVVRWIREEKIVAELTPGGQQYRIRESELSRAMSKAKADRDAKELA